MTERSYQDAVQVLKDRLGSSWEGVEADGRNEMVSILKDQFGYDSRTANDTIDAMIESGTLRYHSEVKRTGDVERTDDIERTSEDIPPVLPLAAGVPSGGSAVGGAPLAAGVIATTGHWQIGSGEGGETDAPGRAGQVTPR